MSISASTDIMFDLVCKLQKPNVALCHQMPFTTDQKGFAQSMEKVRWPFTEDIFNSLHLSHREKMFIYYLRKWASLIRILPMHSLVRYLLSGHCAFVTRRFSSVCEWGGGVEQVLWYPMCFPG